MSNQIKEDLYLGNKSISSKKPLWIELSKKVSGLGFTNALIATRSLLNSKDLDTLRNVTYDCLTEESKEKLKKIISEGVYISGEKANHKRNMIEKTFEEQSELETGTNYILLEDRLKANVKLNVKRLIRMNCYRGLRHFQGKKVRGQSTKSTGRKNKVAKGYQKKKKERKLAKNTATKTK